jgi:hypothetical protein
MITVVVAFAKALFSKTAVWSLVWDSFLPNKCSLLRHSKESSRYLLYVAFPMVVSDDPPPHGNFRLANFVGHWKLAWRARLGNAMYSQVRRYGSTKRERFDRRRTCDIRTETSTWARGTFWKHLPCNNKQQSLLLRRKTHDTWCWWVYSSNSNHIHE